MPKRPFLTLSAWFFPLVAGPAAVSAAGSDRAAMAVTNEAAWSSFEPGSPAPAALPKVTPATSRQIWQLRSALNVAALMCPARSVSAGYNHLLRAHARQLATAWADEQRRFRASHGPRWQAGQDRALTGLYNRIADVRDREGFCVEAGRIVAEGRSVPPARIAVYAGDAAARLSRFDLPLSFAAR